MKGALTLKILEFLEEATATTVDLMAAILSGGYGASFNRVQREFGQRHFSRFSGISHGQKSAIRRRNFQNLLYKLKKEGLIAESGARLKLTHQGREKVDVLRERLNKNLPQVDYRKEKSDNFKIVIFDIPENERQKRNWLRSILANLDFVMLQKSVWVGKNKIPEDLLKDLEKFALLPFVEILEISKAGSLRFISRI